MPLMIAPMACSRIPKCRLRDLKTSNFGGSLRSSFERSIDPPFLISVLVDGARSADPPTTNGAIDARPWITCPEYARVAIGFSDFDDSSSAASYPSGNRCDQ